jgi:hypothetical protein
MARELEPACLYVAGDQFRQAGLIKRHFARQQLVDLRFLALHASHVKAELRQASRCDQADIARTNDGNFHERFPGTTVRTLAD